MGSFWVKEALCLCGCCKQSSLFIFVYIAWVNKALCFCLFMLNKARNEAAFIFSYLFMVSVSHTATPEIAHKTYKDLETIILMKAMEHPLPTKDIAASDF